MGHIVVDNLCKEYLDRRFRSRSVDQSSSNGACLVLDHVTLDFPDGEFVCILGPSGCGKSTLIRILAGFEPASSGSFLLDGEPVNKPRSDNIFVFQHSGLLPWMTVHENVSLGVRKLQDKSALQKRVADAIDIVELTGFEHHYPHQLSGGMQRRAELARALVVNPEILYMDEPFSGLDFLTRLKLREEIINMHDLLQKTIVFITHDIDEAIIMGDRIVGFSERPARVKLSVRLDFPHPRDFSKDSRLAKLRADLYQALGVHHAL
jgi:NitT/TauT family transport system ATP-binding protein